MFEKKFFLEIVTPSRILFRGDVCSLIAPGKVSSFGVLAGHIPFLTILDIGELIVRETPDSVRYLAVSGGFLETLPEKTTVLADAAEWAEEIDTERAENARRRARERLEEGVGIDVERATLALRRAQNRLRVASRLMVND